MQAVPLGVSAPLRTCGCEAGALHTPVGRRDSLQWHLPWTRSLSCSELCVVTEDSHANVIYATKRVPCPNGRGCSADGRQEPGMRHRALQEALAWTRGTSQVTAATSVLAGLAVKAATW